MKRTLYAALAIGLAGFASIAQAQQLTPVTQGASNIKRTPLQTFDVPGTNYQTVIGIAEIVPNVSIGRHTHPGPESGYMLEGEFILIVEGQPELKVKAGESYKIPAKTIHDAKTGPSGAKVIATYVVEKGQPLTTPAP